jgi:hypothetical protein
MKQNKKLNITGLSVSEKDRGSSNRRLRKLHGENLTISAPHKILTGCWNQAGYNKRGKQYKTEVRNVRMFYSINLLEATSQYT